MELNFTLTEFVRAGIVGWIGAFVSGIIFGVLLGLNLKKRINNEKET